MSTFPSRRGDPAWSPPGDISRRDRARFVKEARRLRAQEIDRLLLAGRRVLARAWRSLTERPRRPSELVG